MMLTVGALGGPFTEKATCAELVKPSESVARTTTVCAPDVMSETTKRATPSDVADAVEMHVKSKKRLAVGKMLLKGDSITLIHGLA